MAVYSLLIKTSAAKEIEALDSNADRRRIIDKIAALAATARPHGCEKLAGFDDRYRIRQAHFRVVYPIDEVRREISVFEVGNRKNVWR